ncbi:replication initiator protein [Microvirus sp.]|nr:replication initiator protein [Microvirus sp.]
MCTNPLKILNPIKYPSDRAKQYGYLNKFITVPCGKCEECRSKRHEEIGSLAYAEQRVSDLTMFYTLTYRDEMLPVYNCITHKFSRGNGNPLKSDYKKGNIPCFSREDIQRFYKNVRIRLERYFSAHHLTVPSIKYMNCCEYGKSGTGSHRSHYHGLIYFRWLDGSFSRLSSDYQNIIKNTIIATVESSWCLERRQRRTRSGRFTSQSVSVSLGVVSASSSRGYWCSGYRASFYAAKYSTKDVDFFEQPLLMDWLKRIPSLLSDMADYLPKFTHSKNFGDDLLNDFNGKAPHQVAEMLSRGFVIPEQVVDQGQTIRHPYPKVIVDRYFFNTDYDLVFNYDLMKREGVSEEDVRSVWTLSQSKRALVYSNMCGKMSHPYYYWNQSRRCYVPYFAQLRIRKEFKPVLLDTFLSMQDLKDSDYAQKVYDAFMSGLLDSSIRTDYRENKIDRKKLEKYRSQFRDYSVFLRTFKIWKYMNTLMTQSIDSLALGGIDSILSEVRNCSVLRDYDDTTFHRMSYVADLNVEFTIGDSHSFRHDYIKPMDFVMSLYLKFTHTTRASKLEEKAAVRAIRSAYNAEKYNF